MTWKHNLAKRLLQAVVGCRCSDDEVKKDLRVTAAVD